MLTKERIEREVSAWKRNGEPEGIVGKAHYLELCRLALLGLERDERQAVTSEQAAKDIKILEQIHAKSWDEAVALRHAAEALSERDERAERIGRAVLAWVGDRILVNLAADARRHWPNVEPLLRAIADALRGHEEKAVKP